MNINRAVDIPGGMSIQTAFASTPLVGVPDYAEIYPYHAELCALSELRKKPGSGVDVRSGIGGHSLLYLNGVRLDRSIGHPTLRLCDATEAPEKFGVGISVNSHYRNANWVGVEGRDFVWRGALAAGEPLTRAAYARTQAQARAAGFLDDVVFHEEWFAGKPAGMSARDYMYEISVATDYAAQFGRNVFGAKLPLDRARMAAVIAYLNSLNAPYRDGTRIYRWRLLNDNCAHVAHNALAQAGLWAPWPTGQFFALAAFRFPVPKNEFVDIVLRANDFPIENPHAVYRDKAARQALLDFRTLPAMPGALAAAAPAIAVNEMYDVEKLRLIFYDNPFWGPYRFRFKRIFETARYTDLRENLRHFAARYAAIPHSAGVPGPFQARYDEQVARMADQLRSTLARLP
jgi:hypothetical protein